MATKEQLREFRKYKITTRRYGGNDSYSWAVFLNNVPKVTGVARKSLHYYKCLVLEQEKKKGV